jgi:organic hydroperoxide reductase OsmC/OhrA
MKNQLGDGIDMNNDSESRYEFPVTVQWIGEHKGELHLEGKPTLPISSPPFFGGLSNHYSPQELFISSITACYLTTFLTLAQRMQEPVQNYTIEGCGVIERVPEDGWRFSEVVIKLFIIVPKKGSEVKIQRAINLTEKYCMVSRSVNCPIRVESVIQFG